MSFFVVERIGAFTLQFRDLNVFIFLDSFYRLIMAEYKLEVTTGDMKCAGTWDHIYVTLFGTGGQSERTELDNFGSDHVTGTVS